MLAGRDAVGGARVTDLFTGLTGVTWTAAFAGGATGTATGTGPINELVDLPAGGTVTYTATGTTQTAPLPGTPTDTPSAPTQYATCEPSGENLGRNPSRASSRTSPPKAGIS